MDGWVAGYIHRVATFGSLRSAHPNVHRMKLKQVVVKHVVAIA